jgi:hypothetical protein
MSKFTAFVMVSVAVVLAFLYAVVVSPLITFGIGYAIGMGVSFFLGDLIVSGVVAMFPTVVFTKTSIPMILGVLALVASFFKPTKQTSTTKKTDKRRV